MRLLQLGEAVTLPQGTGIALPVVNETDQTHCTLVFEADALRRAYPGYADARLRELFLLIADDWLHRAVAEYFEPNRSIVIDHQMLMRVQP